MQALFHVRLKLDTMLIHSPPYVFAFPFIPPPTARVLIKHPFSALNIQK